MKKFFAAAIVFVLTLISIPTAVFAESFDGFSVDFPANFTGAYTAVDSEIQSDFFTENLIYETRSDYELMRVLIGESASLDALFGKDFGFANRQDLDLSLLTEQQLANQAEKLTAYIDKSFPLYMTYVSPKSMVVDGRLGLVVTGYYTDYQGGLTGEFRAYAFYYMGQVIIIYYDTQIEGTYFVESVFDLPDSIVETLDFELNPAAQPTNAALYRELIDSAAPVAGFLAIAVLLGILFGFVFKKRSSGETAFSPNLSFNLSNSDKKVELSKKEKQAEKTEEKPKETTLASEPPVLMPSQADAEEAVDWTSMLNDLKKDTTDPIPEASVSDPEQSPQAEPVPIPSFDVQKEAQASAPAIEKAEETEKKTPKVIEKSNIDSLEYEKKPNEDAAVPNEEADPLLAQLKAMDDMTAEISATLGSLDAISTAAKVSAEASPNISAPTPEKPIRIQLEPTVPDVGLSQSKNAETVSENYQSYLDNLLPTRKKQKKEAKDPVPENSAFSTNAENESDVTSQAVSESPKEKDNTSPQKNTITGKKEKKQGVFSRMLSSVADRIERDGEETNEPEFDSRMEMHISEKTERHPVDKLMPGLFDKDPEEESVEILLDQSEDLKFERSKKNPPKSEAERNSQIKNRVDNLFND